MTHAEIIADLKRLAKMFDLRRDNLGSDLLDLAAEDVLETMDRQEDPDGLPWIPLSDAYEEWKSLHFPAQPMAVLFGLMKTREQVRGFRVIGVDRAEMTYGLDDQVRNEAEWFQEGNTHQPPRPFYALTAQAVARADVMIDHWLGKVLT